MSTVQVKPNPDLPLAAVRCFIHPVSGGLLDAAGKVPEEGRPWLYDGVTCRFLTERVILKVDDPVFAALAAEAAAKAKEAEAAATKPADPAPVVQPEVPAVPEPVTPTAAPEADPAH